MALFKAGRLDKKPSISWFSTGLRFTKFRQQEEWLQKYPHFPVKYTLKHLQEAFKKAFKEGGFPKFKSRFKNTPSFTIPQGVSIKHGRILIPKVGYMKMVRKGEDKYQYGVAKSATVSHKPGKWYVSINYELPEPLKQDNEKAIGIDMNVRQMATSGASRTK